MEDTKYKTKTFEAYLVVNWVQNDIRMRKTKPELTPTELAVELDLEVKVPKKSIPQISQTIEIPSVSITNAVAEVYGEEVSDKCPQCGSGKVAFDDDNLIAICTDCGVRWGIDEDLAGGGL